MDGVPVQAEYLDRPVAPYTVDVHLHDGQILRLGDAEWEVVRTPGHTPGHVCLWQPDERPLVAGDALSDYDVGWVNTALDGPEAGIPTAQVEPYPHQRAWLTDAARLLGRAPDALAAELVQPMLRSGSVVARDGRIRAAAEHVPVVPGSLDVPFPPAWPST